jgi:hypothetical protein
MKTQITLGLSLLFICFAFVVPGDADKLSILPGGSPGDPKILHKINKLAVVQVTVLYKLSTNARILEREKDPSAPPAPRTTAYLEATNGELNAAELQDVTDHFYYYLQHKLKSAGIDTVGWNDIESMDFYSEFADEEDTTEERGSNVWIPSNAHAGNLLYGGHVIFTSTKSRKASLLCEALAAPAGFFHLTVDFVDVLENPKAKNIILPASYVSIESNDGPAVRPQIRVAPSGMGNSLFWDEKEQWEVVVVTDDIESGLRYHTAISQDSTKITNKAFAMPMNPLVIETTREQYKAAARMALERYADAFVEKVQQLKRK